MRRGWILLAALLIVSVAWGQDSLNVSKVGEIQLPLTTQGLLSVAVYSDFAYLGDEAGSLHVIDVSSSSAPAILNSYPLLHGAITEIAVANAHAYLACGDTLIIMDLASPATPVPVGYYRSASSLRTLAVDGTQIYLGLIFGGMEVLEAANPGAPYQLGIFQMVSVCGIDIQGDRAYITQYIPDDPYPPIEQLVMADISDPADIQLLGDFTWTGNFPGDVEVIGNYAYVPDGLMYYNFGWLRIFDVSAPGDPVFVSATTTSNAPVDLATNGEALIMWVYQDGMYVIELDTWNYTGFYHTAGAAWSIEARDSYVYAANGYLFSIYDVSSALPVPPSPPPELHPSSFTLHPFSPNPFNPRTVARYEIRDASHVHLRVYDTAGREVATLVDGWKAAGVHEAVFDGTGLASGIYLAKLQAGDFTQTQKLVLLK
ncbi:MAG: T9SS C-terminal target domain-containing protein [Candidatus Zixiibacteriota bacterium]|nr:MAG: T9SS C-terminal target domain-containing protein [candidate division Zixibacteria bacterium]